MRCFVYWVCFCCISGWGFELSVAGKAAILINADTGAILYEKNAYEPCCPASLTKIATALYALNRAKNLDELVTCPKHCLVTVPQRLKELHGYQDPPHWLEPDGTHFWIKHGEILSLRHLLYGLMLSSGNDAANVIAEYISGNVPNFVEEMNAYLKKMGCLSTRYYNPHGLHFPGHMTTAYDLTVMAREALKNQTFCEIMATTDFKRPETNKQEERIIQQHNQLIKPGRFRYLPAFGMKTGYIAKAGSCIVAVAKEEGRVLIAVVLGCKKASELYRNVIALFETAFAEKKITRKLFSKDEMPYKLKLKTAKRDLLGMLKEDISIEYYPSEEPLIDAELLWDRLVLPVKSGEKVGELLIKSNGSVLMSHPLYAVHEVKEKWLYRVKTQILRHPYLFSMAVLCMLVLGGILRAQRRSQL